MLCQQCLTDLTYVYGFIKKCQTSDEILRTTLLNFNVNNMWIKSEEPDYVPLKIEHDIVQESIDIKPEIGEGEQLIVMCCDFCDLLFENLQELKEHKEQCMKHFKAMDFKEACDTKANIEILHNPIEKLKYQCSICNRRLSSKQCLKAHQKVHNEKQYLCPICKKLFLTKYSLALHNRAVHSNEKPFLCDYCGKGFKRNDLLRAHTYTHTGEKPYSCANCDKSFKQLSHLRGHEWMHRNKRPHTCTNCGKSFRVKRDLAVHERIHTGVRPYKCTVCSKEFYSARSRWAHMKTHEKKGEQPKEDKDDEIEEDKDDEIVEDKGDEIKEDKGDEMEEDGDDEFKEN